MPPPEIVTFPSRVLVVDGFALVAVTVIEPLFEPFAGVTLNHVASSLAVQLTFEVTLI